MTALFWKTTAGILVAVVLVVAVGKQEKDLALLLSMAACIMAGTAAMAALEPVLDFFHRLSALAGFQQEVPGILLKITGIGLVSELAQMICRDSGNSALAQGMQLVASAMMLLLSLPVLETLLELIQGMMGEL